MVTTGYDEGTSARRQLHALSSVTVGFRFLCFARISLVFLLLFTTITATTAQTNKDDLEKKKEQLLKEIETMQQQLDQTKKSKNANLSQLAALKKQIKTREKLIGNYNSQISQIDRELTAKVRTVRALDRDLDTLRANYANMVYYAYKHRSAYDKLLFLFSAKDFNDAFIRLKYIKRYSAYRRMQAELIRTTQKDLAKKMSQLKVQRTAKKQVLTEQEDQKKKLAREKAEKDKLAKSFSSQEKQLKTALAKKKKEQEQLKKQIADLIRKEIEESKKKNGTASGKSSTGASLGLTPEAAALSASFASNQGKLPWPVSKGEITETFGEHEHAILENVMTKNNGVDIKTVPGADARAVFRGTVVSIISNPGYHKGVLIKHGEYYTVYSNLASVKVKANQEVETKQSIGTVFTNESGEATVHLEIWKGTTLLNPESWIIAK
ncbi:MAG: peptidoglycan DD-metalloendopeptidase family protein [Chitinophagales bacterium]|nr:peptidoglycan DD-metalloendopeptidase family protein [Chitinophagales bacterium]